MLSQGQLKIQRNRLVCFIETDWKVPSLCGYVFRLRAMFMELAKRPVIGGADMPHNG